MTIVLLLGANGQLGQEILSQRYPDVILVPRTHHATDIIEYRSVRAAIADINPDMVLNAAAYTDVNRAEREQERAFQVNAEAPAMLAELCAQRRVPIIHLSTDYVFDGCRRQPYLPTDAPSPLNIYGLSKAAGEQAVRQGNPRHVILRTSWLYGRFGTNFLKKILEQIYLQKSIQVVSDQIGSPTYTGDLAHALIQLVRVVRDEECWGTFHFAGQGSASWHDFACAIQAATEYKSEIAAIDSDQLRNTARRPKYSVLDSSSFATTFGYIAPHWRQRTFECVTMLQDEN